MILSIKYKKEYTNTPAMQAGVFSVEEGDVDKGGNQNEIEDDQFPIESSHAFPPLLRPVVFH